MFRVRTKQHSILKSRTEKKKGEWEWEWEWEWEREEEEQRTPGKGGKLLESSSSSNKAHTLTLSFFFFLTHEWMDKCGGRKWWGRQVYGPRCFLDAGLTWGEEEKEPRGWGRLTGVLCSRKGEGGEGQNNGRKGNALPSPPPTQGTPVGGKKN